jgi:hypothetical protein
MMESDLDKRATRIDLLSRIIEPATDRAVQEFDHPATTSDTAPKSKKRKIFKKIDAPVTPVTKSGMRELTLPSAARAGVSALEYIPTKRESPWDSFREDFELHLDGFVTIASQRAPPHDLVIVKLLKGPGVDEKFGMLQRVRGRNFHAVLDCFSFEDCRYVVFEHVPISLSHVAKSPPYLSELELAAILAQVRPHTAQDTYTDLLQLLDGLAYLASEGLKHGSLKCTNVLLSAEGEVKICK